MEFSVPPRSAQSILNHKGTKDTKPTLFEFFVSSWLINPSASGDAALHLLSVHQKLAQPLQLFSLSDFIYCATSVRPGFQTPSTSRESDTAGTPSSLRSSSVESRSMERMPISSEFW